MKYIAILSALFAIASAYPQVITMLYTDLHNSI